MTRRLLLIVCLFGPARSHAQHLRIWARDAAQAGAGVAAGRPLGPSPAAVPLRSEWALGSAVLYGLPELSPITLGRTVPGPIPATFEAWGFRVEGYSRYVLVFRSALELGIKDITLGGALSLARSRAGSLGAVGEAAVGLAGRIRASDRMYVGFSHDRVIAAGHGQTPATVSIGLAWSSADTVTLLVDVRHARSYVPDLLVGTEWRALGSVRIRSGWSSTSRRLSFGLGLETGSTAVDLAAVDHDPLGWSWMLALRLVRDR